MGSIVFLVDAKEDVSKFEEWEAPKVVTPTANAPKAGGKRKGGAKGDRGGEKQGVQEEYGGRKGRPGKGEKEEGLDQ